MAKPPIPPTASDPEVRALLERYRCPVAFHEVRTRFLGGIASPVLGASPMKQVQRLWGGELPEFASLEAANELIGALVTGLWNRLTHHQERNAPFRLVRVEVAPGRDGLAALAALAALRTQEIDGFVEGLFGGEEEIELPERADRGLDALGEMRGLIAGMAKVAGDGAKAASRQDVARLHQQMREMTRIAEHEMHEVVLACTRARRQRLAALQAGKPLVH